MFAKLRPARGRVFRSWLVTAPWCTALAVSIASVVMEEAFPCTLTVARKAHDDFHIGGRVGEARGRDQQAIRPRQQAFDTEFTAIVDRRFARQGRSRRSHDDLSGRHPRAR